MGTELLFILVLVWLIFGPKKLPEISGQIGRALGEFRRATNQLKWQLESEVRTLEAGTGSTVLPAVGEASQDGAVTHPPSEAEVSAMVTKVLADLTAIDPAAAELPKASSAAEPCPATAPVEGSLEEPVSVPPAQVGLPVQSTSTPVAIGDGALNGV